MGSGLDGLHMKSTLVGEFIISRNLLALGRTVPPV